MPTVIGLTEVPATEMGKVRNRDLGSVKIAAVDKEKGNFDIYGLYI